MKRLIADGGYNATRPRAKLHAKGTIPVIRSRRYRKRPIQYERHRYRDRWLVAATVCHLDDFRRIATRYDKLACNYLSAVAFWL